MSTHTDPTRLNDKLSDLVREMRAATHEIAATLPQDDPGWAVIKSVNELLEVLEEQVEEAIGGDDAALDGAERSAAELRRLMSPLREAGERSNGGSNQ